MVLKVIFKDPILISSSQEKDVIKVTIIKKIFFVTNIGEVLNEQKHPLIANIPSQINEGDAASIQQVGSVINSIFSGGQGVVTNLFLALSLQLLWKMLGTIQLICHLQYLSVSFPSNTKLTFD